MGGHSDSGHQDKVMPASWWAYRHEKQMLEAEFNGQWRTDKEYAAWLTESGENGILNVWKVFVYVLDRLAKY